MKKILSFVLCFLFFFSVNIFADEDNADSGGDDNHNNAKFAFYSLSESMWKVSVYVGKSDNTSTSGNINNFYRVGKPIFIRNFENFKPGYELYSSPYNKFDYLAGKNMKNLHLRDTPMLIRPDAPAIPVSHNGNLEAVKAYFGNTSTLKLVLDEAGRSMGVDVKDYLTSLNYEVEGEIKKLEVSEIIPEVIDGKTTNRVPWLIMYEPVAVTYLRSNYGGAKVAVAYSATEYALTSSIFNWDKPSKARPIYQAMETLVKKHLPASVVLRESWLGYEAVDPDISHSWSVDKIIRGGGYGMRWLDANDKKLSVPIVTTDDITYRADTDVITSFKVHTNSTTNRIDKFNPDNKASVTFNIGGISSTHTFIIPDGGECYSWVKWHTPSVPGEVIITVTPSSGLYFEDGSTSKIVKAKVIDLEEKRPPDPEATDKGEMFDFKDEELPNRAEKTTASWHEYRASWHEYWVDRGDFVNDTTKPKNPDGTYPQTWESDWQDEGWWEWSKDTYYLNASANVSIKPADECPSAKKVGSKWYLKSGYSFGTDINVLIDTNAPSISHYTKAGNVIATFPEFNYDTYLRQLEKHGTNSFYFKKNIYSQWLARSHFTPLWFRDGTYAPYYEVIDIWTPEGMLKVNLSDSMEIKGNIYDDWHISAEEVN